MDFLKGFVYDAEAQKAKSVAMLQRFMKKWPDADADFMRRYFNVIQLAEIVISFAEMLDEKESTRHLMSDEFLKMDAFELSEIYRAKQLAAMVFEITQLLKKGDDAQSKRTRPEVIALGC